MLPHHITARVINLPQRKDRRDAFSLHAEAQGIQYQWSPGVIANKPVTGVCLAHKQCIRDAAERQEPYALVMEDDVYFPSADGYRWWLAQLPMEMPDIYLGGIYSLLGQREERRDGLWRVDGFCGLHCYLVHRRFFPTFLGLREDIDFDHALRGLGDYVVARPYAAIQRNGFSDVRGKEVNDDVYVDGHYRTDAKP